jgi:acetyl-CoA carboxylase alpha subunit
VIERALDEALRLDPGELIERRYQKFRRMGQFFTS